MNKHLKIFEEFSKEVSFDDRDYTLVPLSHISSKMIQRMYELLKMSSLSIIRKGVKQRLKVEIRESIEYPEYSEILVFVDSATFQKQKLGEATYSYSPDETGVWVGRYEEDIYEEDYMTYKLFNSAMSPYEFIEALMNLKFLEKHRAVTIINILKQEFPLLQKRLNFGL